MGASSARNDILQTHWGQKAASMPDQDSSSLIPEQAEHPFGPKRGTLWLSLLLPKYNQRNSEPLVGIPLTTGWLFQDELEEGFRLPRGFLIRRDRLV